MNRLKISTWLIIFLTAAIILALGIKGFFSSKPVSGENIYSTTEYMWYYLPHEPDKQPKPMEKAKYLGNYDVLFVGSPDSKSLYLTFDDCPNNSNIPKILDVLEKHDAPAIFFMTENYIRQHPDVIQRIVGGGSIVGNHTSSHVGVTGLSFSKFEEELNGVEEAYREATGFELPKYFRPPQGKFNELTLNYAERLGYTTVFWSFRYDDWNEYSQQSEEKAYKIIMSETHPGEILLLHSQSSTNVKILDRLLTAWEEQGYTFEPISDINEKTDLY